MENIKKRERTKELLISSYWNLYKERGPNIFVTDICRKARCNRSTFYRYYSETSEILEEIGDRVIERTKEIFSKEFKTEDFTSLINDFATFDDELFEYYSILLSYNGNNSFNKKVKKLIEEKTCRTPLFLGLNEDERKVLSELVIGIISAEYALLKSGEVKTSPSEVVSFIKNILSNGLSSIVDKSILDKYSM